MRHIQHFFFCLFFFFQAEDGIRDLIVTGVQTCALPIYRFSDHIEAGMVWVNCYKRVHPGSPFGGVGQSGYGRDLGIECLEEYTEPKSIWINYDAQIPPFYSR